MSTDIPGLDENPPDRTERTVRGREPLTAARLREVLTGVPDDAEVDIMMANAVTDESTHWRFKATWYTPAALAEAEMIEVKQPHSRACGIIQHAHGPDCDCPTGGSATHG